MAVEFGNPASSDPCSVCGAAVELVSRELPKRLMAPPEFEEVRVCTNPDCRTNARGRALLESP